MCTTTEVVNTTISTTSHIYHFFFSDDKKENILRLELKKKIYWDNFLWARIKPILIHISNVIEEDFLGGSDGKASVYHAGDPGSIPGSGRSPGEGNGNPLQYCLSI